MVQKQNKGKNNFYGTEILTKDEIIEIEGYEYDSADVDSIVIEEQEDKNVINLYYIRKIGKVITKYKDIETGEEIEETTSTEDGVGKDYTTDKKEIPGYVYVKDTENTSGKYIDGEIKVIYYYRKQVFNVKLDKWVDSIIINGIKQKGNTFDTKDKVIKTEINKNKIADADVKVVYKIRITNDSEVAGKVETLTEKIPAGLKFYQEDNKINWKEENGVLITEDLKDVEIEPGKYAEISITLRWENKEENFGTKTNIAKVDKVNNRFDYEEQKQEDNQGQAELVLAIVTGLDSADKIIATRIGILLMTLIVLTGTVIGIKKKINA